MKQRRRLSAILFTDMVGYTDLMSRDEQHANKLRKRQSEILKSTHSKYKGEILQYFGDGTLSIFDSALNAVRCATEIQVALHEEPRVPLRVGIHMGEVVWEEDGLYGHAVNIASRLESMASPGAILVSAKIRDETFNHPDISFSSVGHFELKNVPEPMELFTLEHSGISRGIVDASGKGRPVDKSSGPSSDTDDVSVAALPFEDLSPEGDQEYLCDGIADEIITDLSGLKEMRVIARHSSSQLKGTNLSLPEIGRKLGVKYLLTGSVRKAGNNLRITAQLVEAAQNRQLWADKFKGTLEDIFDLQETISRQVIDSLDLRLNRRDSERLENRPIEDPRAYDVYLKARSKSYQMKRESLEEAEDLLAKAMDLIGPNSLLIATKGWINLSYIMLGIKPDPIHLQIAESCLAELEQLDRRSIHVYFLRGLIRYKQTRIEEAIADLEKVLEYDPNNREGLLYLGIFYILAGQAGIAEKLFIRLVEIDPLTAVNQIMPGYAKVAQGDLAGGVPFYQKALSMEPQNPMLMLMMGVTPGRVLPADEITPILEQLEPLVPYSIFGRVGRFMRLALEGKTEEAKEAGGNEVLQQEARWDEHAAWWMASSYALIDEKEQAMDWLQISINLGNFNYPFLNEYDPFLENLRGEERFRKMMAEIKVRWESFKG